MERVQIHVADQHRLLVGVGFRRDTVAAVAATRAFVQGTQLDPKLGLTYRGMIWGNVRGMALYWWGGLVERLKS